MKMHTCQATVLPDFAGFGFRASYWIALWCISLPLNTAWADQIVMKNGDRVSGSIIKQDGKTVTIKTEQFGVVTAAWDQVQGITADKPLTVVLQDGKTVQGTLATTGGTVEVVTEGTRLNVPPAQITAIRDAEEQRAFERLENPGGGICGPAPPAWASPAPPVMPGPRHSPPA